MARTAGLTISLNNYSGFREELRTLDRVIADLDRRIDTVGTSFDNLDKSLDKTERSTDEFEKEFKGAANTVARETKNIDDGVSRLQRTAQTLETIGTRVSIGISAPAAALKAFAISAAISFEDAFAGVVKTLDTTGLSAEQTIEVLAELRQGIRDLATDADSPLAGLSNAHDELARIDELGGQLGVAREDILAFTETIGLLAMTTDLGADAAATNTAQFANIMQSSSFDRIGATIVDLGNKSAATESQILEFGQRLAGAFAQVNASEADVLGFGAAMASVGLNAEAGGTAITRVINTMIEATALGGESLTTFAEVAGLSTDEFKQMFEEDAAGAIETFISGLGELESVEMLSVFESLGFSDIRVSDTLRRLSSAPELLADSLDVAGQAFENNSALAEEAHKRFATTASKINLLKNNIKDLAISLGDVMLPGINRGIDVMVTFIQHLQEASPAVLRLTATILGIAAAAGPVILTMAAIAHAFAFLGTIALPPLWLIVGAIAALGLIIHDLRNNVGGAGDQLAALGENLSGLFGLINEIGQGIVGVFQFVISLFVPMERSFSPVAAVLGFINEQIDNLTTKLGVVRDFLTVFNMAQGNMPSVATENDSERNRLLDERKRLLEDINRLDEEGLATQSESLTVQVEQGDTLWDIARQYGTTVDELMRLNDLDSSLITIGQQLTITEGSAVVSEEMRNLRNELSDVDEMLRRMPAGVQSAFDAFAETPLFDRIFGTDEGARDRALAALAGISAEAAEIRTALGGMLGGFTSLFSGDFDAGIETIRSGFASIVDSVREMFSIFSAAGPQMDSPLVALTGDMGDDAGGGNLFAGLKDRITAGLEAVANADFSGIQTMLEDNLGTVFTLVATTLGSMFLPPLGIFIGLAAKAVDAMEIDFSGITTLIEQSSIMQSITAAFANLFGGGETFMLAGDEGMFAESAAQNPFLSVLTGIVSRVSDIITSIQNIDLSIIGQFFKNLFGPILFVAGASLDEGIFTLFDGIKGFIDAVTGTKVDVNIGILSLFDGIVGFVQSIISSDSSIGQGITSFIDGIRGFFASLNDIDTEAMGQAALNIATVLGAIGGIIAALAGAGLEAIGTALPHFGAFLVDIVNFVLNLVALDFVDVLDSLVSGIGNLILTVGGLAEGAFNNLIGLFEALTGANLPEMHLVTALQDIGAAIVEIGEAVIGGSIQTFFDFITNITTGNFENTGLGRFLAGLPDMFSNAFRAIGREIGILIDTFMLKWQAIQALLPGGGEADEAAILETTQRIQSARVMQGAMGAIGPEGLNLDVPISFQIEGQQFNDTLRGWLSQPGILDAASEDSRLFIENALNAAASSADLDTFNTILALGIQSGMAGEMATMDIAGMSDTLFANLDSTTVQDTTALIGEDLVTGLTQGITDNEDQVLSASESIVTNFQDTLNDGFGIESPSLWMQDIGFALIEGLQIGLTESLPLLEFVFILLKEQFGVIVMSINFMFDSVLAREMQMIELMKLAGQVWGVELRGMEKGIMRIGSQVGGLIPKIVEFIALMGKIPAIAIIGLQGTAPGTPPPSEAYATVHATGGPGFAGMIAKVAEPEIGGIEIIKQDGGGTYIVSGRDFMAVPPIAAPIGSLPLPPSVSGSNFGGGGSIIFEQPVIIENPSGGDVTPDTIAAGLNQWQRQNPPRRDMRGSL